MIETNDPSKLIEYVNKHVKIELKSSKNELCGWVYTIDPVSLNLVLIEADEENNFRKANVIQLNENVKSITIIDDQQVNNELIESKLDDLFRLSASTYENIDLNEKRKRLIEWFKKHHIPIINEFNLNDNYINIMDSVLIREPYNCENCESTNEIVLDKVTKLIKKFENS